MSASPPARFASLWVPFPKRKFFTYAVPPEWKDIQSGDLVWAPFGKRKILGMVDQLGQEIPDQLKNIKELSEILPQEFSLHENLQQLMRWAHSHYLAAPGEVLRAFLPPTFFKGKFAKPQRSRQNPPSETFQNQAPEILNEAQQQAIASIQKKFGNFSVFLLDGITGSGKTEVYLKACAEILKRGQSALVLVPEIGLTPQTLGRFFGRFGEIAGEYHSDLSEAQKLKLWWEIREGTKRLIVGTRSAITLPLKNLGLIVVDEEHDPSYKQEERFRYHGRDLAIMRAKFENIPIVLGSATPSTESFYNVELKKYLRLKLPQRATQGQLPTMKLIDLKTQPPHPHTLLSKVLQEKIAENFARGEQSLLFLNRRGFAPFLFCHTCGEIPRCPNCQISLTYHRRPDHLLCHYCNYRLDAPKVCHSCGANELAGAGVGTERLEDELAKLYPGIRLARLDRDSVKTRQQSEKILSDFAHGKLDLLIGTQMVTKGHDFKRLTLVGILMADLSLGMPDFRAAERIFQLMTQVAGRAGRHELAGEVYLQTYRPEHYAIAASLEQNSDFFLEQECRFRQEAGYPPFSRLILLRVSGNSAAKVQKSSEHLAEQLRTLLSRHQDLEILGPSKALLEKLRGKYRWQILLKSPKFEMMRRSLEAALPSLEKNLSPGVQLSLDVDPMGMI